MTWRTHILFILLRDFGRKLRLNKYLANFFRNQKYEDAYHNILTSSMQIGDCVWDIGANVGYYTLIFSRLVGDSGSVIAFEPSPDNFEILERNCKGVNNIKLFNFGLGSVDEIRYFSQGKDELGATSRIVDAECGTYKVQVYSAESLLKREVVPYPNIIKCDVEGFELEVLEGMSSLLKSSNLRVVGIEVHFGILSERKFKNAPRLIENILNNNGFSVQWTDGSHIIGKKNSL